MGDSLPVADRWWAREEVGPGITRLWEPAAHELIQANVYFVKGRDCDLLVDAGLGLTSLRDELDDAGLIDKPLVAVATHADYDHIGSLHEFADRRIHEEDAEHLAQGDPLVLFPAEFPDDFLNSLARHGMEIPELLIDAAPEEGFDPERAGVPASPPTSTLAEGDAISLGDRSFTVLHLPGHSPGEIGLWDPDSGTLFAGDAVYRGALLDEAIPGADIQAYLQTMRRLRDLPVTVVYPGHETPLDREEMIEIIDSYLALRDPGGPDAAESAATGPRHSDG